MQTLPADGPTEVHGRLIRQRDFVAASSARELGSILRPAVNIVHWKRSLPKDLLDYAAAEARHGVPPVELECDLDFAPTASLVAPLCSAPERAALLSDIQRLTAHFRSLSRTRTAKLFFGTVNDDKCRKFHSDYVGLRMVCTYAGPGTQLVPNAGVVRAKMNTGGDIDARNAEIVPDLRALTQSRSGDVVLLKGELWPGNHGRGAVHRSPPLAGKEQPRLVLILTAHRVRERTL